MGVPTEDAPSTVTKFAENPAGAVTGMAQVPATMPAPAFKFVDNYDLRRVDTPMEGRGYAETWPAGEGGSKEFPRPAEIPLDKLGIQVFKPDKWTDRDTAGELLHIDPVANYYRGKFADSLTPNQLETLRQQPDFKEGDQPDGKRMQNAVDAAMRGYTVGQWPKEAVDSFFNPSQRKMMDSLRKYMITGKR